MSEELTAAASSRDLDKVNQLIAGGSIDINYQDNRGNTALIWAAYKGREDVVKALIAAGADLSLTDQDGNAAENAREQGHGDLANYIQDIMDGNIKRPTLEEVGLDMSKSLSPEEQEKKSHAERFEANRAKHRKNAEKYGLGI